MKFSPNTLTILKNFSSINSNLTFQPGNVIQTISVQKNIMASANVSEQFDQQFGIYSLPDFLGALSLFGDPDLSFKDKYVNLQEGSNSVKFYAADPSLLTQVPNIKPFPTPFVEFELTKNVLQQVLRASAILHVSDFSIAGDGNSISTVVGDKVNATSNTFSSVVSSTDKTFKANLKIENLKVIPDDYKVSIASQKIFKMEAVNNPVQYWIALETDSSFGG